MAFWFFHLQTGYFPKAILAFQVWIVKIPKAILTFQMGAENFAKAILTFHFGPVKIPLVILTFPKCAKNFSKAFWPFRALKMEKTGAFQLVAHAQRSGHMELSARQK